MAKTVQLLAVVGSVKEETGQRMAQFQHAASQPGLFEGHSRTYRKRFEDGADLPDENKKLRGSAEDILDMARTVLTRHWDLALTLDTANAAAKADVTVNGRVLLPAVPVGHLLWLARELEALRKLVTALPVLSPAHDWSTEGMPAGQYKAEPVGSALRQKVPGKFVLYEATKEHPAQVQRLDTDEVTGTWTQVSFSGALPQARKDQLLARLTELEHAVKMAREEANTATAPDQHEAEAIFGFLLG